MSSLNRLRRSPFVALLTLTTLVGPMIPTPSRADTAPTAPAAGTIEGQTGLGSDESGGAAAGSGLAAASVQASTGILQSSYPFDLPRARGDVQPQLALAYASTGGLGVSGQGWDLALPSIVRQPLSGAPNYLADPVYPGNYVFDPAKVDRFTFGGEPLIPICAVPPFTSTPATPCKLVPGEELPAWASGVGDPWVYYRLEKEDGSLLRFFWSPARRLWRVTARSGATMEFGVPRDDTSDTGGIDLDAPTGRIFRWNLVRQYDTHRTPSGRPTNLIKYAWSQFGTGGLPGTSTNGNPSQRGYLTDIFDTPPTADVEPATSSFAHHVHLAYSNPGYSPYSPLGQSPIRKLRPTVRLDGVDVTSSDFAGGAARRQVRRYHLGYTSAGWNYQQSNFELTSIQMEGTTADPSSRPLEASGTQLLGPTNCKTYPATTFAYSQANPTPTFTVVGRKMPTGNLPGILDANGDGLLDVLGGYTTTPPVNVLFLNSINSLPDAWPSFTMAYSATPTLGETAMGPSVAYNAGSFLPDGHLQILWFGPNGATTGTNTVSYDVFDAVGGGSQWQWQRQTSGTINLYQQVTSDTNGHGGMTAVYAIDEEKYANADIDGDGFVDLVTTARYTPYQPDPYNPGTRLLGARFSVMQPNGVLQPFVYDPGFVVPNTLQGIVQPQMCVGGANDPDNLFGTNVYNYSLTDFNGDGIPDWIRLGPDGVNYWAGHGDGVFGSCSDGSLNCPCTKASRQNVMEAGVVPNVANGQLDDVTGDGLADLIVPSATGFTLYPNSLGADHLDGLGHVAIPVNLETGFGIGPVSGATYVYADMNGSGADDVILGWGSFLGYVDMTGGSLPGLLTDIDNGIGGHTHVTYDTTPDLDYKSNGTGNGWTTHSPQSLHVVTSITAKDALPRADGSYGDDLTTLYAYWNPVFDGRDRTFIGFQTVDVQNIGSGGDPTRHVITNYYEGTCQTEAHRQECGPGGADYVMRSLRGLPIVSEVADDYGNYLSTTHRSFAESELYTGLDGRNVHLVLPTQVDTYAYEDGPFVPSASSLTGAAGVVWHGMGNNGPWSDGATFTLRSSKYAHSVVYMKADPFGNVNETDDYGYVTAAGAPTDGIDVQHWQTWAVQPDTDQSNWTWRAAEEVEVGQPTGTLGTVVQDPAHDRSFKYDAQGNVTDAFGLLSGTLLLQRSNENGAPFAPSPPAQSSTLGGTVKLAHLTYDPAGTGNVTRVEGPNQHCTDVGYDTAFSTLQTVKKTYTGGCGTNAIVSMWAFDGVIGQYQSVWAPNGARIDFTHDEFGLVNSIAKPDPARPGQTVPASTTISTVALPGLGEQEHTVVKDPVTGKVTQSYLYTDGFGRFVTSFASADPSAGDQAPWTVVPRPIRGGKGNVIGVVPPAWFNGDPSNPAMAPSVNLPARKVTFDAFGRPLSTRDIDGTQTTAAVYHASSVEERDAEELNPASSHAGAYTLTEYDGHRRTVKTTTFSKARNVETDIAYAPTGEVKSVTRTGPDATYTRWMQYDSFRRLVLNAEPNTSVGFTTNVTQAAGMKAWRYAYDDAGDLVGTSDARGCGENLFYDGAGRKIAEDYSPCLAAQGPYTPYTPDSTGSEVWNTYLSSSGLDSGQLGASFDRAQEEQLQYDARGRLIEVNKWLAKPVVPSSPVSVLDLRYETTPSIKKLGYDEEDRLVSETTGADVSDLFGQDPSVATVGPSTLTNTYSARGGLLSVQGSYGTLLAQVTRAEDGAAVSATYGDLAGTKARLFYDSRRRLHEFTVSRAAPALWSSASTASYSPPSVLDLGTTATVLADDIFTYDAVSNPTNIADKRYASEWPAGYEPTSRAAQYDDDYHLQSVTYANTTPTSSPDIFKSPSPLATTNVSPLPMTAPPKRVQSQGFAFDSLGNMTSSTDESSVFFDRSLGTIMNGDATGTAGPHQLQAAWTLSMSSSWPGNLKATYDAAGNVVQLAVERDGACAVSAGCMQLFHYDWDEVGQLARARRYDFGGTCVGTPCVPDLPRNYTYPALPPFAAAVDVSYAYDGSGARVLRASSHPQETGIPTAYTAEIFSSLRLENAAWSGSAYERDVTTESVHLVIGGASYGRVVSEAGLPSPTGARQHIFLGISDSLGSTTTTIDKETSELVERTTYQAFGATESDFRAQRWQSFRDTYKFTGKEDDVEVGLTYFGARYYSPQLARWMSPDPLTIHGVGADLNPYAYVGGSPLRWADPTGLSPESQCDGASTPCEGPSGAGPEGKGGVPLPVAAVGAAVFAIAGIGAAILNAILKPPPPPPPRPAVHAPPGGEGSGGGGASSGGGAAPSAHQSAAPPAPQPVANAKFDPLAGTSSIAHWILTSNNPVANFMSSDRNLANVQEGAQFVTEQALITAATAGAGTIVEGVGAAGRGLAAFVADTRGGLAVGRFLGRAASGVEGLALREGEAAATGMQAHHIFPQEMAELFEKAGINIEKFRVQLSEGTHLGQLHSTGGIPGVGPGGLWNETWRQYLAGEAGAGRALTPQGLLGQAAKMLGDFNVPYFSPIP